MWFKEDKIFNGFIASLIATVILVFVIFLLQKLLGIDILTNAKMYVFSCVGEILILRWYAGKEKMNALKGAVISLILTLGAVFIVLMKYNYITV